MIRGKFRFFVLLLFSIFIFNITSSVFAGGDGSGGGGGASVPLEVTAISVEESEIAVTFSKNVTNASVKDNNLGSFELYDSSNNGVSFVVSIPDDNLEPEKRQTITLVLDSSLSDDEEYRLVVKSGLAAKSGQIIEGDGSFTLKVGEDPMSSNSGDDVTSSNASSNSNSIFSNPLFYVIIVLVVIGVVVLVYVVRRKSE